MEDAADDAAGDAHLDATPATSATGRSPRRLWSLWIGRDSRAPPALRRLLNVAHGVWGFAAGLAVVDVDLADAPRGVERVGAARRVEDADRDQGAVQRVARPVGRAVDLLLDRGERGSGRRVRERVRLVLQSGAQDRVAH